MRGRVRPCHRGALLAYQVRGTAVSPAENATALWTDASLLDGDVYGVLLSCCSWKRCSRPPSHPDPAVQGLGLGYAPFDQLTIGAALFSLPMRRGRASTASIVARVGTRHLHRRRMLLVF